MYFTSLALNRELPSHQVVRGNLRLPPPQWQFEMLMVSVKACINEKKKKVGFTSFFPRFAGSDVLIQCMSNTTHSLSNQTCTDWFEMAAVFPKLYKYV